MYAVVYADSGQVVALRRSEKEARQVAETRKAGGKLDVKRQASHDTASDGVAIDGKGQKDTAGKARRDVERPRVGGCGLNW